jgi:hypothetical protein
MNTLSSFARRLGGALIVLALCAACMPHPDAPDPDLAAGTCGATSYVYLRLQDGLRLMIWHDILQRSLQRGMEIGDTPVYWYHEHAESPDGRRLDWQVETSDGRLARLWIDDTSYDLADDQLFIVTTRQGATKVAHVQRSLESVPIGHESCEVFAAHDPDLDAFVSSTPAAR